MQNKNGSDCSLCVLSDEGVTKHAQACGEHNLEPALLLVSTNRVLSLSNTYIWYVVSL